eukprot:2344490-Rhodomonas_salina.1
MSGTDAGMLLPLGPYWSGPCSQYSTSSSYPGSYRPTPQNQTQETAKKNRIPGMRFLVFDCAVYGCATRSPALTSCMLRLGTSLFRATPSASKCRWYKSGSGPTYAERCTQYKCTRTAPRTKVVRAR